MIINKQRRTRRVIGLEYEKGFLGFEGGWDSGCGSENGLWSGRWWRNADIGLGFGGVKLEEGRLTWMGGFEEGVEI